MLRRVVALAVAPALLLAGCASAGTRTGDQRGSSPLAATSEPSTVSFTGSATVPSGGLIAPDGPRPDPLDPPIAPSGPGRLTARTDQAFLWTWRDPGPGATSANRIASTNPFRQPMSFLVQDVMRDPTGTDWVRIRTGEYPNGATAWVRATDVRLATVHERIVVDLSKRRLLHIRDGEVHSNLKVAIGDEDTPTVPGRYFVWARVRYSTPAGPYGKLALGLSGFSEVVRFGPTPGRLAIHGTSDPSDRGQAVSLGCVRVYNGEIDRLWSVPMGTPVIIRP